MTTWYSKALGDGMMASIPSSEIELLFQKLSFARGNPLDMAVFTRHESEGRLHCEVIAYFSPTAAEVAKAVGAQPCPKPARSGLGLLAGEKESWSILFPEADNS
jgi:hypothetical protein